MLDCVDGQQLSTARNSGQSLYVLRHGQEPTSACFHLPELLFAMFTSPELFIRDGDLTTSLLVLSDGGPSEAPRYRSSRLCYGFLRYLLQLRVLSVVTYAAGNQIGRAHV